MRRRLLALAAAGLALVAARCDWLFGPDREPPYVVLDAPEDSAVVSGTVQLQAQAADSVSLIKSLEFLVDGAVLGAGTFNGTRYVLDWSTSSLSEGSRHTVWAAASDEAGNIGYSDTAHVTVHSGRDTDIFHGAFTLRGGYYWWRPFRADTADSILGAARTTDGQLISEFFWCDSVNFELFQTHQGFTAIDRQTNQAGVALANVIPAGGRYYLVLANQTGATRSFWARFYLRGRQ